jgi:sugar lactone lactonase YvrE
MRVLLLAIALLAAAFVGPPVLTIKTIAGDGTPGLSATQVNDVLGLTRGPDDALYFSDSGNHMVRRLDLKTHLLTTVAGNGEKGNRGDGGLATKASLNKPLEVLFDTAGNLYVSDSASNVVRRVDAKTKTIKTIAGTGNPGFSGDGGPAVEAQFDGLSGLAFMKDGSLLICDSRNNRIRRVVLTTGKVETFAGTGESKTTPDGSSIQDAPLRSPRTMAVDSIGNIYLALPTAIYKLDVHANRIMHIAGSNDKPDSPEVGDGPGVVLPHLSGAAKLASLFAPKGMGLSPDGKSLYVADTEANRVLRIDLESDTVETVAGTGQRGDAGVGHNAGVANSPDGDAYTCRLSRPHGIVVGSGVVYFTDSFSNRIRMIR